MQTKSCREEQNTFLSHFFFGKDCCVSEKVEKCGRASQATDDNTALAD